MPFATRQHLLPVLGAVECLSLVKIVQLDDVQNLEQRFVGATFAQEIIVSVRVDDLISEGAQSQVWLLWNVEELADWRLGHWIGVK